MKPTQDMINALDIAVMALKKAGWKIARVDGQSGVSYLNLDPVGQKIAEPQTTGFPPTLADSFEEGMRELRKEQGSL